jgi:hypothetical protein
VLEVGEEEMMGDDEFKRAVEAELVQLAKDVLGKDLHVEWTVWPEWPEELRAVLCDGTGTYTAEFFEPEDQVSPLTDYAKSIIRDAIGELDRRPWSIEPPACSRCATPSS